MNQASGIREPLPAVSLVTTSGSGGKLWKRWQITYVLFRAIFLLGFFFLMEGRHGRDPLRLESLLDNRLLVQAMALLTLGTLLELGLFTVLNRWQYRRPNSGVAWRALIALAGESILWAVCFLPVFYFMLVGPAVVEIVNTLSRSQQ
ncbi:MAG TPA: hypothetical protein VKE94_12300 [Gemmataceae bacterium]|nr:hypothetical protein [Gemmataceae bacterium]